MAQDFEKELGITAIDPVDQDLGIIPVVSQQTEQPSLLQRAKDYYQSSPILQRLMTGQSNEDTARMLQKGITTVGTGNESFLPELEHPTDEGWLGYLGRGAYNQLIRPLGSPSGFLGAASLKHGLAGGKGISDDAVKTAAKDIPLETPQLDLPLQSETPLDRVLQRTYENIPVDENTGMKIYNPEGVRSLEVPGISKPISEIPESVQKLRTALNESIPLNKKQRELYRVERAEKVAKAADVSVTSEADLPKFFGALQGKHTRVDITPLRESLEQVDIDDLISQIRKAPLTQFEQANAFDGLSDLLDGRVPTDYDIIQMSKVFGSDFGENLKQPKTLGRMIVGIGNNLKGLKSAGDFGLPFRQGRNYAYRESWFKSIIPMMKAYGSDRIFNEKMALIKADPFFSTASDKMKVAFTDLSSSMGRREETAVGKFVGELPLVKSSNRAATLFANNIRMLEAKKQYNLYKTAYDSGMKLAKTPEELSAAKLLNPDNPYVAAKIGDRINVATGRGKLPGNLEKIAPELNATLFSPRLMASRIRSINRVLNPISYMNYNPIERKEAVKQLLSLAAAGATEATSIAQMYKAAGKDVSIETSPDSTDFLKVKIDNTRYDPWGGYQQYFVPVFKILMGTTKPTTGGERQDLNKGAFAPGGFGTLTRSFLENKLSPLGAMGDVLINRGEVAGRPLNFTSPNPFENTITRALTNPIIVQDAYDILREDPTLGPLLIPDMFGQSVQVYEHR